MSNELNLPKNTSLIIDEDSQIANDFSELFGNKPTTIGIAGERGEKGDTIEFVGEFDENIIYVKNQAVGYLGSTYIWVNTSRDSNNLDIPTNNPSTGWELAIAGGQPGIDFKGAYTTLQTYSYGDIVTSNGSSYLYINPTSSSGNSVLDITYFELLAVKGDDGSSGSGNSTIFGYGFQSFSAQSIVYVDSTRKFHIVPTNSEYEFYINSVKFTKSVPLFVDIPLSLAGWVYIYFDSSGILQFSQTRPSNVTELRIIDIFFQNDIPLFQTIHFRTIDYAKNDFEIHNILIRSGLKLVTSGLQLSLESGIFISDMNLLTIDPLSDIVLSQNIIKELGSGELEFYNNFSHIVSGNNNKYFSSYIIISPNHTSEFDVFLTNPEIFYDRLIGCKLSDNFTTLNTTFFPEHSKAIYRIIYFIDQTGTISVESIDDFRHTEDFEIDNTIILNVSGDKNHIEQVVASNSISFTHELNKLPSVTIIDMIGNEIEAEVDIIGTFNVSIQFNSIFSGFILLN